FRRTAGFSFRTSSSGTAGASAKRENHAASNAIWNRSAIRRTKPSRRFVEIPFLDGQEQRLDCKMKSHFAYMRFYFRKDSRPYETGDIRRRSASSEGRRGYAKWVGGGSQSCLRDVFA